MAATPRPTTTATLTVAPEKQFMKDFRRCGASVDTHTSGCKAAAPAPVYPLCRQTPSALHAHTQEPMGDDGASSSAVRDTTFFEL
jgi:hypothetical protein